MASPPGAASGGGNGYKAYKQDTSRLTWWIINTTKQLLGNARDSELKLPEGDEDDFLAISVGQAFSVAKLVKMSRLIALNVSTPSYLFQILRSVIVARSRMSAMYQKLHEMSPDDEEMAKSNRAATSGDTGTDDVEDDAAFINRFNALRTESDGEEPDDEDDNDNDEAEAMSRPAPKRNAKGKKGKKGKGKKAKTKKPSKAPEDTANEDHAPIESYRIIEDENTLVTDYLVAVHSLAIEWAESRFCVQETWRNVAYDNLNSAVAGAVSNAAVARVRNIELAIFVDFPGHDSYETVLQTMTRGRTLDEAQSDYGVISAVNPDDLSSAKKIDMDIKEQFLYYAYRDLVDFVIDYQQNRTGRPTKKMEKALRNWDPTLDVRRATKEERLAWRRAYTINWLYDLVNVFATGANADRRLMGITEFAGFVAPLARQKPGGDDIRRRIRPHHVFQLQCIVDSMTVSRGWGQGLHGHLLEAPAPISFRAPQDVDYWLDRDMVRPPYSFLPAAHMLQGILMEESSARGKRRTDTMCELIGFLKDDFNDYLGRSDYPLPSRFASTHENGLWEYSPYLCGIALADGLRLAYQLAVRFWDNMPEPVTLIHIHSMLVKKGYMEPVLLFESLEGLMRYDWFVDGVVPSEAFYRALYERFHANSPRAIREILHSRQQNLQTVMMMMVFNEIENELRKIRHPAYRRAYSGVASQDMSRIELSTDILADDADDDLLKAVTRAFETNRPAAEPCSYWYNFHTQDDPKPPPNPRESGLEDASCVVM